MLRFLHNGICGYFQAFWGGCQGVFSAVVVAAHLEILKLYLTGGASNAYNNGVEAQMVATANNVISQ